MRPAEATSKDTSIVAAQASVVAVRRTEVQTQRFASVLQATRQSSRMLMGLLSPPQPAESGRSKDADDHSESTSRTDQVNSKEDQAGQSNRADRKRLADRQRAKAARTDKEGNAEKAVSIAQSPLQETHAPMQEASSVATAVGVTPMVLSNTVGSVDVAPTMTTSAADSLATTIECEGMNESVRGSTGGATNTNQQPNSPAIIGNPGVVQANGSVATAEATTGNQGQSAGSSQDAAVAAMLRATGTTGRAGGNNDFQQLLNHLDRSRPTNVDRGQASTATAKFKTAPGSTNKAVDLEAPGSVAELARIVRSQVGAKQSSMVLELSPAELGRVRVDVRMQDSTVLIRFATESITGQQEIKNRLDDLKGALEQQGITVDRVCVEMLPTTHGLTRDHDMAGQQQPHAQHWDVPADGRQGEGQGSMPDSRREDDPTTSQADVASWLPTSEGVSDWVRASVDVTV